MRLLSLKKGEISVKCKYFFIQFMQWSSLLKKVNAIGELGLSVKCK